MHFSNSFHLKVLYKVTLGEKNNPTNQNVSYIEIISFPVLQYSHVCCAM